MKYVTRPEGYRGDRQETFEGANLNADEIEFGLAMERYRRERQRPFPTCSEILQVLKTLGYRKDES